MRRPTRRGSGPAAGFGAGRSAPAAAVREVKYAPTRFSGIEADGAFCGYASLFGKTDLGGDMVMPGAFARSLQKRGAAGVRMLYQHDPDQVIGTWTEIVEDARGLFVRGRILTDVKRGREVLALMRAGALDGLSIGFRSQGARTDPATGIRRLTRIDLWEISLVTFPLLPAARVTAVKSISALADAQLALIAALRQATRTLEPETRRTKR